MIRSEKNGRRFGGWHRGVDHMPNASFSGGVHGILMLLKAHARLHGAGADEQKARGPGKGSGEVGFIIEIGVTHVNALVSQCLQLGRLARGGDDLVGRHLVGVEQVIDDSLAQMARGTGDEIYGKSFLELVSK